MTVVDHHNARFGLQAGGEHLHFRRNDLAAAVGPADRLDIVHDVAEYLAEHFRALALVAKVLGRVQAHAGGHGLVADQGVVFPEIEAALDIADL